ncbi:GNAT family N-acetyltransferase [Paenibacillus sp. GYB003]|uniref:GNAT family N-acetyltransferase n=1 Tax=Paenibacillus sp. GYB003 TaxID=2994392 RepID=UPI002F9611AC
MEQIRLVRPEQFEEAARLADLVFRDAEHKSMRDAYPHAFSPSLSQSYGAFEDGTLVSFVGFVPAVVRIGEAELNVYSIGAVCTHPDYRGKGYVSRILDRIREHSIRAGAPVVLVSGNRPLYERFGCRVFGSATSFSIDREAAAKLTEGPAAGGAVLRPSESDDWFALKRLAAGRDVRYEQSLWDLASLIYAEPTASNGKLRHRVWVAERDGRPAAFAVIAVPGRIAPRGKPALIEWAGDPPLAAAAAARGMTESGAESLRAVVPWHETAFAETLRRAGCAAKDCKQSGTVAITDPQALLDQLGPYLRRIDGDAYGKLRFAPTEQGAFIVAWEGGEAELSCDAFIAMLFDQGAAAGLGGEGAERLKTLFPIPFPYTAGLNYV